MKHLFLLLIIISLSACLGNPKEVTQSGDFKVEFLFEKNGCKMYRFRDGGRFIYWSDCSGRVSKDFTSSNGKTSNTRHEETITTE